MEFDVEHIDSIESLNFKLFVLERVLFGDVSNFTPITGRRTTTEFDLFQASQVQDHSKKVGTSKGSVIYLSIFDLPDESVLTYLMSESVSEILPSCRLNLDYW